MASRTLTISPFFTCGGSWMRATLMGGPSRSVQTRGLGHFDFGRAEPPRSIRQSGEHVHALRAVEAHARRHLRAARERIEMERGDVRTRIAFGENMDRFHELALG